MATELAGLKLQNLLMNGAYIGSKTTKDMRKLIDSQAGAVVVGSISVKPRIANSGPGYWRHKDAIYSLNSFGMPNGGIPYFKDELPKIAALAHARNKPVIANVVGFTSEEFVKLVALAQASGCNMVELNLGCPNVWDGGKQKRIFSYHADLIKEILERIKTSIPTIPISVKISPLPPDILCEVADVIKKSEIVNVVVATNSYPNALVSSEIRINDEGTLAGLSGRALKPISLGVVRQLRDLLPSTIDVIGCGGIDSIHDVNDYVRAGAQAVQIVTALMDEGVSLFERLKTAG